MRLRKITVISVITLQAHFSQGIAKFATLPNLLLTLGITVNNLIRTYMINCPEINKFTSNMLYLIFLILTPSME